MRNNLTKLLPGCMSLELRKTSFNHADISLAVKQSITSIKNYKLEKKVIGIRLNICYWF